MAGKLRVSIGQHSDKGRKAVNQDFHGAILPEGHDLALKGVAIALADGISSSEVSQIASESSIKGFLTDYYCTSEAWSVKTSAQRVLAAANSWLHAQNLRSFRTYEKDRGYVCTFSALILKGASAHLFHVGDARIFRVSGIGLEQLTNDHRIVVSSEETYLGRALGVNPQIEIDYRTETIAAGDVFVLATDGVYEYVDQAFVCRAVARAADLDAAARAIVAEAFSRGSDDNLTVQIVRVDSVARGEAGEIAQQAANLPPPPLLEARNLFDGYRIVRELHASSRSHLYLAQALEGDDLVALKIPSIDLRDDPDYLRRFVMEEWVARRISNAHVLKPAPIARKRNYLYVAFEFVDGQTLAQWMADNPKPDLETVRGIVEQIARGLQAFHRKEMIHQDLRPANVMIDRTGTAKIIDFGSTRVAGVVEAAPAGADDAILGTAQYTAPEYFLGESGSARSDIFSLGVIAYQMLTGRLPYGAEVSRARSRAQQRRLAYASAAGEASALPAWVDAALRKAVHADPRQRFGELSEFAFALRNPVVGIEPVRLIERDPAKFWKLVSAVLAALVVALLYVIALRR